MERQNKLPCNRIKSSEKGWNNGLEVMKLSQTLRFNMKSKQFHSSPPKLFNALN
jgi:hypothetical protein